MRLNIKAAIRALGFDPSKITSLTLTINGDDGLPRVEVVRPLVDADIDRLATAIEVYRLVPALVEERFEGQKAG